MSFDTRAMWLCYALKYIVFRRRTLELRNTIKNAPCGLTGPSLFRARRYRTGAADSVTARLVVLAAHETRRFWTRRSTVFRIQTTDQATSVDHCECFRIVRQRFIAVAISQNTTIGYTSTNIRCHEFITPTKNYARCYTSDEFSVYNNNLIEWRPIKINLFFFGNSITLI